jgi:hypothetical protein
LRHFSKRVILYVTVEKCIQDKENAVRDFGSGWGGLKEYAIKVGVANVDDTDDAVAAKVKAVIQGTMPEGEQEPEESEGGGLLSKAADALGLGENG